MDLKFVGVWILGIILSINVYAQDKGQQSYMKIFKAEQLFASENYNGALEQLNAASEILDTTNNQIEYWRAKTYLKLEQFDDALEAAAYYLKNEKAKASLQYQEIEKVRIDANIGIENEAIQDSLAVVNKAREKENAYWLEVRRKNTVEDYQRYLKEYPDGHFAKLARNKIKNIKVITLPGSRLVDAVKRGDYDMVTKLVLKDSVDVNHQVIRKKTKELMQGKVYEIYHETPLYMAIYKMDMRMIMFLLEQGADPNGVAFTEVSTYKEEVYKRSYLSSLIRLTSKNGLHKNKEEQTVELIRLLVDYGLDVNYVDGDPLAQAVYYRVKGYRRTSVIRELLRNGADPKGKGLKHKGEYYSALDIAKLRDDDYIIDVLKDKRYKKERK